MKASLMTSTGYHRVEAGESWRIGRVCAVATVIFMLWAMLLQIEDSGDSITTMELSSSLGDRGCASCYIFGSGLLQFCSPSHIVCMYYSYVSNTNPPRDTYLALDICSR